MAEMLRLLIGWRSALVGGAVLCLLSLSGCLTTPIIVIDDCDIFAVISYSANLDTAETVIQIRRHNAQYLALCVLTDALKPVLTDPKTGA